MANVYFPGPSAQSLAVTALPRLWLDKVTAGWHRLLKDAFDSYRPERHYMRGPGPRWRARHRGHAATAP
jgi:hypothetical protein